MISTRIFWAIGVVAILSPFTTSAQMSVFESDSGDQYAVDCNSDGYVLSVLPFGAKVYLGRSCDAYSDFFGGGYWCEANAGTMFKVGNFEAFFSRTELTCPGTFYSPHTCLCSDM